jgi:hypothetical protein
MRHALKKLLALLVAVSLAASTPVLSHARMSASHASASHEVHVVQHYADLSVDPDDEGCPNATPGGPHHQDNDLCKRCCSACLGATLIPAAPVATLLLSGPRDVLFTTEDALVARAVPTEPGIPKPL